MNLRITEAPQFCELPLTEPVVLGRQSPAEAAGGVTPFADARDPDTGARRVVVAWNAAPEVSERHVLLRPVDGREVRVENLSSRFPVRIAGRDPVPVGGAVVLPLPLTVQFPRCAAVVVDPGAGSSGLLRLEQMTLGPGDLPAAGDGLPAPPPLTAPQVDQLVGWLQTTVGVLQQAVGAADFVARAAKALVEIVGLRSGRVFLRRNGQWEDWPEAAHPDGAAGPDDRPSRTVLDTLVRERRTLWQPPSAAPNSSLFNRGVVAAPLVGAGGEVVGVLYGDLPGATRSALPQPLTAALVDLLAGGVSAGLARRAKEEEAARERALFGQFFSEPLAAQLRGRSDLLRGKRATVTVLFADIRGYSGATGRVAPGTAQEWLSAVLNELSRCVLDEDGVLVDYVGDELMAMWGAPADQPDQTGRAVRAGLAMIRTLPRLNREWRDKVGGDTDIGVGVNRGDAQVGNVGSRYKFKYGALGDVVNTASRVQGVTKYLKRRLLVTRAAHYHLTDEFAARRVVKAQLLNIAEPVDLFEVAAAADGDGGFFCESEAALDALESGRFDRNEFARAGRLAGELLGQHPGDGPLLLTLSRAADALIRDGQGFNPVWTPPGK